MLFSVRDSSQSLQIGGFPLVFSLQKVAKTEEFLGTLESSRPPALAAYLGNRRCPDQGRWPLTRSHRKEPMAAQKSLSTQHSKLVSGKIHQKSSKVFKAKEASLLGAMLTPDDSIQGAWSVISTEMTKSFPTFWQRTCHGGGKSLRGKKTKQRKETWDNMVHLMHNICDLYRKQDTVGLKDKNTLISASSFQHRFLIPSVPFGPNDPRSASQLRKPSGPRRPGRNGSSFVCLSLKR